MRREKTVGIIQARMTSSRLPGKMMMDLCGYPVIHWVIERTKRSAFLNELVLATTVNNEDDCLCRVAEDFGISVYRGDENDVLLRFIGAAKLHEAETVVRICADNPLVAPEEIDRLVQFFHYEKPDYAFNHRPGMGNGYPDGLGAEATSLKILEGIAQATTEKRYREHVTLYIWDNPQAFTIRSFPCSSPYNEPRMKLDIDTIDDLQGMRGLCGNLSFHCSPDDIFRQWLLFGGA